METAIDINCPVTFTANAVKEVKRILDTNPEHATLRVGVKGGGCSGMTYVLEFDQQQPSDMVFEIEGVTVVMSRAHEMYLQGMEVDFGSGLNDRGFAFKNPNATKTCGCGTSFAV